MEQHFFAEANNGIASCQISSKSVAVLKEYNLRQHYDTIHLLKYLNCPTWYIQRETFKRGQLCNGTGLLGARGEKKLFAKFFSIFFFKHIFFK